MHYYLTIFFNTKQTIQRIHTGEQKHQIWIPYLILAASAGYPMMWDMEATLGGGIVVAILAFIVGTALMYYLIIFILPGLYYGITKLFGGTASFDETQVIISLAVIPQIVVVANQFLRALLQSTNELPPANPIIAIIVQLFSFKIMVVALACYNKITYQKAFVVMLATMLPPTLLYAWVKM